MEFTGGSGVDLIVDPVGAPYLQKNIDCMAVDARYGRAFAPMDGS